MNNLNRPGSTGGLPLKRDSETHLKSKRNNIQDYLAFTRTPGKVQILHIELWYQDGSRGELNITSPHCIMGEDLERQYLYMRMYLQKAAPDLGIVAYQANLCFPKPDGTIKILGTYAKVDCTLIPPFKPGQFYDNQ